VVVSTSGTVEALHAQLGLAEATENLLSSFLRSVSHDLKSPLLTLSLSVELLDGVFPDDERGRVAHDALTHGIEEMNQMLDAVTGVSRARRRILGDQSTSLIDVLRGHVVLSESPVVSRALVHLDLRPLAEALRALGGAPVDIRAEASDHAVRLSAALPANVAEVEGSCVGALLANLQQYSGTSIAQLAAAEVALARQGASLSCVEGRVQFEFPITAGGRR
jgi:hypothetical protein